ncbi:MAG: riboflavin synthase [Methylococcales bacterium]|jgi:riboflavin synthase|nr:riboflavin synthase [Methylococcaceae bacterium]HIL38828.1 riboflavin synthase [Methylococcales bacterium]
MFTGIILAIGKVERLEALGGDYQLTFNTGQLSLDDVNIGDSIAVNGVCLTAVELTTNSFSADVSRETLSRTTLGQAKPGTSVNLELALAPTTRLGGHFVSGHVDGLGTVLRKEQEGRSFRFDIKVPQTLGRYIAEKGSICIDGISLTVNQVAGEIFSVNIVPHTLSVTTLGAITIGDTVNIEVDVLARYLERLIQGDQSVSDDSKITALLNNAGFIKG